MLMARRKIANTLALAVLGLLQERPMHPYEMASTLRERHKDSSFKINSGSLYDTVEALAREGWIEPVETDRDGRRPERTVYAFTALGQREFLAWIDELIATPVPSTRSSSPRCPTSARSGRTGPARRWPSERDTWSAGSRRPRPRWPTPSAPAGFRGCS